MRKEMNLMKRMAILLLVSLVQTASFAQSDESKIETLSQKVDSLQAQTNSVQKLADKLNKLKISGYIQAQYQYGEKDATMKVGDSNEDKSDSFNRFGIRRGRIKFEYDDGLAAGAIQLDASEKGVAFRDLYIKLRDPWTKRSSVTVGMFNRPFGHEIGFSTSNLESPERATIIQYFFPDERDLGAMLTLRTKGSSPLNFMRLDAGLFAGNSINKETDSRKDFIGRLGAEKEISCGKWGLGLSYYDGHVFNPTATAYEMDGEKFVPIDKGKTGTYMRRQYIGMDGQFSFENALGKTTLRAEGLLGTQPGTASSSKSPNSGTRPADSPENALFKRPFLGYFFYFVQDIGKSPFSAVLKYDTYDPNTKIKGDEVGVDNSYTSKTDLAQSTLGVGALYRFNKHLRLQAYYEFNFNEKSKLVSGYESDRKDNLFTLRVQYKF